MTAFDTMPNAAISDIGIMARRLIEQTDLSVVPGLLDCLEENGRERDAQTIREALGQMMCNRNLDWQFFVIRCGGALWFDMFDLTDSLAKLEKRLKPKYTSFSGALHRFGALGGLPTSDSLMVRSFAAVGTIRAGDPVAADSEGRVVAATDPSQSTVGTATSDTCLTSGGPTVDVRLNPAPSVAAEAMTWDEFLASTGVYRSADTPPSPESPAPSDHPAPAAGPEQQVDLGQP